MGNEQSASSGQPSTSASTFSFLSNKGSVKKNKGIVVVNDGTAMQEDPQEDPDYKRLMEIPRFMPILRSAVSGGRPMAEGQHKLSHRPIWRLAIRLQDHLHSSSQAVSTEQNRITQAIKTVDVSSASVAARLVERKKKYDRFRSSVAQVAQLRDEVVRIQLLLEEIVPCVETLNELLRPEDRLPPLDLGRVLGPADTSSAHSVGGSAPSVPRSRNSISPIEETRVVDKF